MLDSMTVLDSIVEDLRTLPASELVKVAAYVHGLNPRSREERLAALRDSAACLTSEEWETFEKAVREEGERVDAHDW